MNVRWLARLLLPRLLAIADGRRPDLQLFRADGRVAMRRWWLLPRNSILNCYLHNMVNDDDDFHDHPYWSASLILADGIDEWYQDHPDPGCTRRRRRALREGDIVIRRSTMAHRLIVRHSAWTLFITGPRIRLWGFWPSRGFVPHDRYFKPEAGAP
jgi:hypothetical protein